jgi:hypothetical protein
VRTNVPQHARFRTLSRDVRTPQRPPGSMACMGLTAACTLPIATHAAVSGMAQGQTSLQGSGRVNGRCVEPRVEGERRTVARVVYHSSACLWSAVCCESDNTHISPLCMHQRSPQQHRPACIAAHHTQQVGSPASPTRGRPSLRFDACALAAPGPVCPPPGCAVPGCRE